MDFQSKSSSFRFLATMCKDHSHLDTKIAFITFKNQTSHFLVELTVIVLEYFQLLSQTFLIYYSFGNYSTNDNNIIADAILFIAKLLSPGTWLEFNKHIGIAIFILAIAAIQTLLKYLLLVYIVLIAYWDVKGQVWILKIWSNLFKIQYRVLYFISTCICFAVFLAAFEEKFEELRTRKVEAIITSIIFITAETALSLLIQFRFCYVLPTKSFFSSKDNTSGLITFFQKFTIQILQAGLAQNLMATEWILVSFNVIFSVTRVFFHFTTLPNYSLKALKYKGVLLSIVMSSNLVAFVEKIIRTLDYQSDMTFLIIVWILSSFLAAKFSNGYLERLLVNLMINNSKEVSPELQVQKIFIAKELRKLRNIPHHFNEKCDFFYLMNQTISSNLQNVFNIGNTESQEDVDMNLFSKRSAHQIFVCYLENLTAKYPSNMSIKLYLAYFCAIKLSLYSRAMRMITHIRRSYSYKYSLNASLLILEMQNSVKIKYKNKETVIDLSTYVKSRALFAQLKEKILEQAKLQIQLYQEILDGRPDLEKLFSLSQLITNHRNKIEKKSKTLLSIIPEYYTVPFLVIAEYNLMLNFSQSQYNIYFKQYSQKLKKYQKHFEQEKLIEENLYETENVFFMCSCEKPSDAGKILFCTKNVEKVFGGEAGLYIGVSISNTAIPSLRSLYSTFYRNRAESGNGSLIGTANRAFAYHKDGYMFEIDFYVNVHPYMTQGYYLGVIARLVPACTKEYLWLLENGDIDVATKNFSEKFGLLRSERLTSGEFKKINVRAISQDLRRINEAFNMVAKEDIQKVERENHEKSFETKTSTQKKTRKSLNLQSVKTEGRLDRTIDGNRIKLSHEEAIELYGTYSAKDGEIIVNPLHKKGEEHEEQTDLCVYKCSVENKFFGPLLLKFVTLEEPNLNSGSRNNFENILSNVDKDAETIKVEAKSSRRDGKSFTEDLSRKNSGDFELIDENDHGYTNQKIETIQVHSSICPFSGKESLLLGAQEPVGTTEGQLISPARTLKQSLNPQKTKLEKMAGYKKNKYQSNVFNVAEEKSQEEKNNRKAQRVEKSKYSHVSRSGHDKRVSDAFENALKANYYPAKLKIVYALFYALVVGILLGLFLFKFSLEDTVNDLRGIKETINICESKIAWLLSAETTSLIMLSLGTGKMDISDLGYLAAPIEYFVMSLKDNLVSIASLNPTLLGTVEGSIEENHDILFRKDVRMFDSYYDEPEETFTWFNSFQATDRFVDVGLKGVNKMFRNITSAKREIQFILRNAVNDLLVKNEDISQTFMESLREEKEQIDTVVIGYLTSTVALSVVKTIIFLVAIWRQYYNDKSIMLALTKFNHRRVSSVLDQTGSFIEALENGRQRQKGRNRMENNTAKDLDKNWKTEAKNQSFTKPKLAKKQRRYSLYTVNFLCFMMILIGSIAYICFSTRSSIQFFQTKQNQIYFIHRLKSLMVMLGAMSQELIAANATTLNHNNPISDQLVKTLKDLTLMRSEIPLVFLKDDSTYDTAVDTTLFTDGCFLLDGYSKLLCQRIELTSTKTSLINLISTFETLITERKESFDISDKSFDSLARLESKNFDFIFTVLTISATQCQAIYMRINDGLDNDLLSVKGDINLRFWLFFSYLAVYGLLLWIFFLKNFNEINNHLKKVLLNFPHGLVLSNFTLKLFLTQVSNNALDLVKNDI